MGDEPLASNVPPLARRVRRSTPRGDISRLRCTLGHAPVSCAVCQSSAPIDRFLEELRRQAQAFHGERLISLAVFGSHASGRARPGSDLDLLIILSAAAPRRRQRLDEFDRLEEMLAPAMEALEAEGLSLDLSPVIRTREEAEGFSILYLDMTVHVRLLVDRDEFLRRRLDRMRAELQRLGAERRTMGDRWYWVLKKDYRPGEVFEIS
jgi:predicted nucleotidyltransferase